MNFKLSSAHSLHSILIIVSMTMLIITQTNVGNDAYAITREDIDELKKEIQKLKDESQDKLEEIDNIKDEIRQNEIDIEEQKQVVRDVNRERNESWESQVDVEKEEDYLKELEELLEENQTDYIDLLNEQSDIIRQIEDLEEKLEDDEQLLKFQSRSFVFDNLQYTKLIGIELSNTCITMIKNNFTTTCPTYEELSQLDTSIEEYSGEFIVTDGFYHRDESQYKNSWKRYESDPTIRIIVDPPAGMNERIKMIILKPNFDTYTLPDKKVQHSEFEYITQTVFDNFTKQEKAVQVLNQTQQFGRVMYHDRYVDDNCKDSTINADIWKTIIPDTIHYLRTDCTITSFVHEEIIHPNVTKMDITNSTDYQHKAWIERVKEHCIFKFKECTS